MPLVAGTNWQFEVKEGKEVQSIKLGERLIEVGGEPGFF